MAKYTFAKPRSRFGATGILAVLLTLSLGLNLYLLFFQDRADRPARDRDDGAAQDAGPDAGDAGAVEVPTGVPPADRAVGEFTALEGVDVEVRGSLSQAFDSAVPGRRSLWLTATSGRILVWWVDLSSDFRAGDQIQALYEPTGDEEVRIAALVFHSQKMDREYRAYHFRRDGDEWGSYWDAEGVEVPARLTESPMQEYEQITALLGDGRDHRGIDFAAPVGTPVYAVRDATVTRTTWNFKYNGNSLELRYADGTMARYLHLEGLEEGVTSGAKIAAGQQVARCGNTGRTSAPHLHYEIEQAGRIVDPLDYHGTTHRKLEGTDLVKFQALVSEYDELLEQISSAPEEAPADGDPGV